MKKVDLVYFGTTSGMVGMVFSYAKELNDAGMLRKIIISKNNELKEYFSNEFQEKVIYLDTPSTIFKAINIVGFFRLFILLMSLTQKSDTVFIPSMHPWLVAMLPVISLFRKLVVIIHDARPHDGDNVFLVNAVHSVVMKFSFQVLFCSEYQEKIAKTTFATKVKTGVVRHPVFYHYRNKFTFSSDRKDILFLGRLEDYKGLDLLEAALFYLPADILSRIKVVGKGNSPLLPSLSKLICVDNRYVPDAEIPEILNCASTILLPYKSATQSGLLTLAGQARCLAVITPIPELLYQAEYACEYITADSFDPKDFANAILEAVSLAKDQPIDTSKQYASGIVEALT